MINALIIDDEKNCRLGLKSLMQDYCENVNVIGMAETMKDGFEQIKTAKPDLVFLDILMPDGNGFQMLEKFQYFPFQVIFTTAYHEYAIRAIKVSALDYLLKPISRTELKAAVDKMREKIIIDSDANKNANNRIMVHSDRKYYFIAIDDIIRIKSEGRSVSLIVKNHDKPLKENKTIAEYEMMLAKHDFFKIHRCHLINMKEVTNYLPDHKGGFLLTSDKKYIPVAESRKNELDGLIARYYKLKTDD